MVVELLGWGRRTGLHQHICGGKCLRRRQAYGGPDRRFREFRMGRADDTAPVRLICWRVCSGAQARTHLLRPHDLVDDDAFAGDVLRPQRVQQPVGRGRDGGSEGGAPQSEGGRRVHGWPVSTSVPTYLARTACSPSPTAQPHSPTPALIHHPHHTSHHPTPHPGTRTCCSH